MWHLMQPTVSVSVLLPHAKPSCAPPWGTLLAEGGRDETPAAMWVGGFGYGIIHEISTWNYSENKTRANRQAGETSTTRKTRMDRNSTSPPNDDEQREGKVGERERERERTERDLTYVWKTSFSP